jgi:hypothetical protein
MSPDFTHFFIFDNSNLKQNVSDKLIPISNIQESNKFYSI